ncbi:MAG: response regulator [Desulfobacterales bacterium]|nr:response regulator [Desulfobacterales bacterium]
MCWKFPESKLTGLTPIICMSEMLLEDFSSDSMEYKNIQQILTAGERGRDLVQQILTFSRQTEHKMVPVRIQSILKEVLKLAISTIPANIEIVQDIQNDCGFVTADPTQIHQIAMNIITNAYHAVETAGGKISIQLREAVLEGCDLAGSSLEPGPYVILAISDTGCGISPAIMGKIFEPYFTTKEQGKGTGLGLSVVYGIVKDHFGDIKIYSEVGQGTTVNVYLPIKEKSSETASEKKMETESTGNERILVVDDDESVEEVERKMLERLGYQVTTRTSALDALAAFRESPDAFDLIITDMTMPNMTGDQLARELILIKPDIPVIVCTGFSEKLNKEKAKAVGLKGFLMKPVSKAELAKTVRKVLDEAAD